MMASKLGRSIQTHSRLARIGRTVGIALVLLSQAATAISLGEIDLRSFRGQQLDARVPIVTAAGETFNLSCVAAKAGETELLPLSRERFSIAESLESRILIMRTYVPIDSARLRLELTAACPSQVAVTRIYNLTLPDLDTVVAPPINLPVVEAPASAAKALVLTPTSTLWRTGNQDTLGGIVKGLLPDSTILQEVYLGKIRAANPSLAVANDATLPAGSQILLPNLRAFANESAKYVPASDGTMPVPAADSKPAPLAPKVAQAPEKPPARLPVAAPAAVPVAPALKPVQPQPAAAPAALASRPSAGGFSLRLSGAQMDLSRSKGISESTRASLRDKQLILDSDDQVAALLALKNTVKQLETRLNDLQLKLSISTQLLSAAKQLPPAPLEPTAPKALTTAPIVAAPVVAPAAPIPAPAVAPPAAKIVESAPLAKPVAALPTAMPGSTMPEAEFEPWWMSTWVWLSVGVILSGALAIMLLRRRSTESATYDAASGQHDATSAFGSSDSRRPATDLDETPQADAIPELEHEEIILPDAPPEADLFVPVARPQVAAMVEDDDIPASLELDTRPALGVDFPLMGDDVAEDKVRRQRYMEERYPELANASVAIDEPDSIIDAARHYYEESQIQRASELLTYAFEERPGQLRFWLALLEIYRLERMPEEFSELAARFKNVHGGTDVWPKVQHIGRDLDPANALFAAALGRLGVSTDREFDAIAENWLNAPMDFTSDVLMTEMRRSLLDEHRVSNDELQGLSMVPL